MTQAGGQEEATTRRYSLSQVRPQGKGRKGFMLDNVPWGCTLSSAVPLYVCPLMLRNIKAQDF